MIPVVRNMAIVGIAGALLTAGAAGQNAQQLAEQASRQATPAATVPADQQASPEQLSKLFEVMRIKQQMQSMRTMVPGMVQQQIQAATRQTEAEMPSGSNLTPEQREKMQAIMNKYVAKAMDLYPADEMLTDMTSIYQKHLSKDDVEGLIAFYSSPAGQHLLDAQPVIAQEYMPLVMGKVAQRSQAMTKEMMKEMAEVVPASKPATAKPGSAKPAPKTGSKPQAK
jgi:hypothetical protein